MSRLSYPKTAISKWSASRMIRVGLGDGAKWHLSQPARNVGLGYVSHWATLPVPSNTYVFRPVCGIPVLGDYDEDSRPNRDLDLPDVCKRCRRHVVVT